ncbi:MAG: hypothetical protein JW786_10955 [Desulfobacterales bacterium]|nr:hypothetical protein [Desulfobacterales bacterium]
MIGQRQTKMVCKIIWAVLLLTIWPLCSCDFEFGNDSIHAAQEKRIQTFFISENSLEIITQSEPTIEISDGTTQYNLLSDGRLSFTLKTGVETNIFLENGDIIIERPASGAVTVIRSR